MVGYADCKRVEMAVAKDYWRCRLKLEYKTHCSSQFASGEKKQKIRKLGVGGCSPS